MADGWNSPDILSSLINKLVITSVFLIPQTSEQKPVYYKINPFARSIWKVNSWEEMVWQEVTSHN